VSAVARPPRSRIELTLLVAAVTLLTIGGALALVGHHTLAATVWATDTLVGVVPAGWWVIDATRHRRWGVDLLALFALVGTLVLGEHLAGAVITVMLASGRTLEARAAARARHDLHALVAHAPRVVHRRENGALTSPAIDDVVPGDLLLVQSGEVVPVDGLLESDAATLDESALTGEPLPVDHNVGDVIRSGVVNAGGPFDLRATTIAAESTYAGVVRLVSEAESSNAPFVRLADRYAALFVAVALALAGAAWALSGAPERAVAVLVVATPCPLILAAPVAIVSGLSRSSRRGVVVKGGAALEQLANGEILLFDKTGTITAGRPHLADVVTAAEMAADEVLRYAACLEQVSPHVLAAAVVRAARGRGLALSLPDHVEEVPGSGVRGRVDGHTVAVGKAGWTSAASAPGWTNSVRRRAAVDGALTIFVDVDGAIVGALMVDDPIRPDAARTIRQLRRDGIRRIVMVTGDREENARTVGAIIGVDDVLADRTPAEKVDAVRLERRSGRTIMVGDGINDAPALALADVGVALGARGATASSEAADVVLTVDRLERLGEARVIARRSRRIAIQSVAAGMSMSAVAMFVGAFGYLPPVWGALTQEIIDVAVIVNALRALRDTTSSNRLSGAETALARRFSSEHRTLSPELARIRDVADHLDPTRPAGSLAMLRDVQRFLVEELDTHEQAEDRVLYPVLARVLGGNDPTATMSRAHVEIGHLIRRIGSVINDLDIDHLEASDLDNDDIIELRRLLYGLHAILKLHFAQEDEGYLSLADDDEDDRTR